MEDNFANNSEPGNNALGYTNWCAIAAFFDGDGGLDVEPRSFTLHWALSFVDNWPPQLLQIKSFLESCGIRVNGLRRSGHGGWKIQVSEIESLRRIGRLMLKSGCLVKKKDEIERMIRYYDDRIPGTEVGAFFNEEVYSTNGLTMYQLASVYQVSPSTIYRVIRGLQRGC